MIEPGDFRLATSGSECDVFTKKLRCITVLVLLATLLETYVGFGQIQVGDGHRHFWGNLAFTIHIQAATLALLLFHLLLARKVEVAGAHAVLRERPSAIVLDVAPGDDAVVSWVAPALVRVVFVVVSGCCTTGQADHIGTAASVCVFLCGKSRGLAQVELPVGPVGHIQVVWNIWGTLGSHWGVH